MYASSNLSEPANLMTSGSASCRAQRIFEFRCAHHTVPLVIIASATTAATKYVRRDISGRAAAGWAPDDNRAWQVEARSRTSAAVIVRRSRLRTTFDRRSLPAPRRRRAAAF